MAWIYVGVLVLGLLANWRDFLGLPYGLGFLLPLIPIALATHHFRLANRLGQAAMDAEAHGAGLSK